MLNNKGVIELEYTFISLGVFAAYRSALGARDLLTAIRVDFSKTCFPCCLMLAGSRGLVIGGFPFPGFQISFFFFFFVYMNDLTYE